MLQQCFSAPRSTNANPAPTRHPQALNSIFERLRSILHEGAIDKRVQYMIEGLYAKRKDSFVTHPGVIPQLDLVEADDQVRVIVAAPASTLGCPSNDGEGGETPARTGPSFRG
eukprot:scaffold8531_cov130-Isochrysis_galbana.AAC.19